MSDSHPDERVVWVEVQPRPYPVIIRPGGLDSLGALLAEHVKAHRAMIITDSNVGPLYADRAVASLKAAGFEPSVFTVEAGEGSKSLATASRLYDALAAAKIDRACPAVSLGGGVVGDLTGFVAATWLRGIPFAQCSTTVEANVDASVGGKTAVNHASGKNMVGAFYQPRFVLMDPEVLSTLSRRDFVAGLAESIKHAVIRDAAFFDWHERHAEAIQAGQIERLPELLERNVRIKADIVSQDEREVTGVRALLNFGHTIGHAIESAMARRGQAWRHGEAVATGMIAAAEMSVASGRLDRASAQRIAAVVERTGLPVDAPLADAREELMTLMHADKKVAAGQLRFVLADEIGRAGLYGGIELAWVEAGLDRVLR
ncbi:MAG: 3-dehydroquinate synthase [Phycisphaerae bacterium]|nr:3-dehydroquinate synthase [Phycisphaerae bacterium]